jgi:hypothetical protein
MAVLSNLSPSAIRGRRLHRRQDAHNCREPQRRTRRRHVRCQPEWFAKYCKHLDVNAARKELIASQRAIEALQTEIGQ